MPNNPDVAAPLCIDDDMGIDEQPPLRAGSGRPTMPESPFMDLGKQETMRPPPAARPTVRCPAPPTIHKNKTES